MASEAFLPIFDVLYPDYKDDMEKLIQEMRNAGAKQLDTIICLKCRLGLSLAEADRLVLYSVAWKDQLEATERLRDEFWTQ